jgi:hypothetical protein
MALTTLAAGAPFAVAATARGHAPVAATPTAVSDSPPYDGRFAFVRIRFGDRGGIGDGGFGWGRRQALWAHDHPRAEANFLRILDEITTVDTDADHRLVLATDDPELFRYPIAYIVEVGYWQPGEAEVEGLRQWLLKGGFLIVDDFRGPDLRNFERQLQRVLPGARLFELDGTHELFDSFFRIPDPLALAPPTYPQYAPVYLGVFEDNDPTRRLMMVLNYNNDIGDYWEFSDVGYYPIDLSNEAYKFGVNYIVYAMTH